MWVTHRLTVVWISASSISVSLSAGFQLMQDVEQRALHSEHGADQIQCLMTIFVSAAWEI